MTRVAALGAVLGAALGLAATVRSRDALRLLAGLAGGAVGVALLLTGAVAAGQWLFEELRGGGLWAAAGAGAIYAGALGWIFGGLGIAFFGFVLGPPQPAAALFRASFGRGATIVSVIGASFGVIAGAVVGALLTNRLL